MKCCSTMPHPLPSLNGLICHTTCPIPHNLRKLWPSSVSRTSRTCREYFFQNNETCSGTLKVRTTPSSYQTRTSTCTASQVLQQMISAHALTPRAMIGPSHIARIEAKLDYWREDPMLHAFHCMLHHAWCVEFKRTRNHFV